MAREFLKRRHVKPGQDTKQVTIGSDDNDDGEYDVDGEYNDGDEYDDDDEYDDEYDDVYNITHPIT